MDDWVYGRNGCRKNYKESVFTKGEGGSDKKMTEFRIIWLRIVTALKYIWSRARIDMLGRDTVSSTVLDSGRYCIECQYIYYLICLIQYMSEFY